MVKTLKMALAAMLLTAAATPVWAADPSDTVVAQNKLLAMRAARADGMRKLAERIKGLHITSQTTVKDFVTESDQISTAMQAFMVGLREKEGSARYLADGTCEVTMEVTLETVVTTLKEIHDRYYKGDKFKGSDFVSMTQTNSEKVLSEIGNGAPRALKWEGGSLMPNAEVATGLPNGMTTAAWEYWKNVPGQARLMAVRAGRLDGVRKLAERIKGVYITSNTQVQDFVTQSDEINTITKTMLVGARETAYKYHVNEPIVEVEMAVTLRTVYETIKSTYDAHYKGDRAKINEFEERSQRVEDKLITETGMGVAAIQDKPQVVSIVEQNNKKWPAAIRAEGQAAVDTNNENKAQAKLMAYRGAELDARRKLAEQLDGLMITSNTSVKDFVTQNDEIRTAMMTFQQNARAIPESKKELADGTVQITVEIDPEPLWSMVMYYQKTLNLTIK